MGCPYELSKFTVLAACSLFVVLPPRGFAEGVSTAQQWAVLIAVQKHDDSKYDLSFTSNDAKALRQILVERAGLPADRILTIIDDSPAAQQPTLENIRRELPKFLKRAGQGDQVIIFYSGHGHPVGGQTYLVPRDFRLAEAEKTGLPASELRKALVDCSAKAKFLILDCCHAGGTRDLDTKSLTSEDVAKGLKLEEVAGCVILASCKASEQSLEWPERQQGAFTYWLCRALEGGADKDGDGRITADEVYAYTEERVRATAERVFRRSQSPVRYIGLDVQGVTSLLSLRPEPPESLCRRLGEHLDLEIRSRALKRGALLEFSVAGEKLASAALPRYCADQVQAALAKAGSEAYMVLNPQEERYRQAIKDLRVEAVGDPTEMERFSQRAGGVDALITGTLRRRGNRMQVQCDLVAVADGNSLVTPSGAFPLSEDLVGDTGASFATSGRPAGSPYQAEVVNYAQSSQDHPLLLADFPFRLELWSIQAKPGENIDANTTRKRKEIVRLARKSDGNENDPPHVELVVAAREDELFEIRIENKYRSRAAMTLLVDGINTLGQKRERLGKAWSWVLEPAKVIGQVNTHTYEGWYLPKTEAATTDQGEGFAVKRFQFVDVADSVAGRRSYGDSIGVITAAFYAERGRMLGVGEGPEEERNLHSADFHPGRLLGILNLRYVEERDLQRMLRNR